MLSIQEQKAEMLAEIKAILPKGWSVTMSATYSGYTRMFVATVKVPVTVIDKLRVGKPINNAYYDITYQADRTIELYQNIEEMFEETEIGNQLSEIGVKVDQILNVNSYGEYDEGEQRYDRKWFSSLYFKPSKKAIENSEIESVKYYAVADESGYLTDKIITYK